MVKSKFNNPKSEFLEIDHIVIAIVSTRDVEHVVNCLRSLANSSYRNFRVVVCENGGFQAFDRLTNAISSLACMSEFTGNNDVVPPNGSRSFSFKNGRQLITIFKNATNLGYAGGVNACVAAVADAPWEAVWVLNPDTFPDANALAALVQHQKSGGYGIVGSRFLFASNGRVQTWGGMKWRNWLGRCQSLGLNMPAEFLPNIEQVEAALGFISGASMYVSRAYVEAVGLMDEDFFVYDEDVDWCLRHGPFKLGYAHRVNRQPCERWNLRCVLIIWVSIHSVSQFSE